MGKLATVQANGLELSIFPWESPELVIADIEAMLEESYAKPWLLDEDIDASEPVLCNWSFLEDGEPEATGGLVNEPGYLESTQPWLF